MRHLLLRLFIVLACSLLPAIAFGEEDKFSGYAILRNDFKFPHAADKKEYMFQRLNLYARQKLISFGLDVDYAHKLDYTRIRPSAMFNLDPLYLSFGYQSLNFKAVTSSHLQLGAGVAKSFARWNGYIDLRSYWGVDKKSDGFLELWAGLYRKIGENWFIGPEIGYDHWLKGVPHDWILAGTRLGYQLTKEISVSIRLARVWNIEGDRRARENEIQSCLKYSF